MSPAPPVSTHLHAHGPRAIPLVPLGLGLGGLLPFWGLAAAMAVGGVLGISPSSLGRALAIYGAIIASFLGGIRWGLAVRDVHAGHDGGEPGFIASVVPSLLAWACFAAPLAWTLGMLGVLILVMGPLDLQLVRDGKAPPWFGRLRLILSAGAGLALIGGAFAATR